MSAPESMFADARRLSWWASSWLRYWITFGWWGANKRDAEWMYEAWERMSQVAERYERALQRIASECECSIGLGAASKHGDTPCAYHIAKAALDG